MRDVLAKEFEISCALRISRVNASRGPDYVKITLTDRLSSTDVMEAKVPLLEFAEALLGLADRDCSAILRPAHAGQRLEHKTEEVTWTVRRHAGDDEVREAKLAALEVEGWIANRSDATNHHRAIQRQGDAHNVARQLVGFYRWVDVEPEAK